MQFSYLLSHCNCLLCRLGNGSWLWDVGNAQTSALWDRKRKWGLNSAQAAQSACLSCMHTFSPQLLMFRWGNDSKEAIRGDFGGCLWELWTFSPLHNISKLVFTPLTQRLQAGSRWVRLRPLLWLKYVFPPGDSVLLKLKGGLIAALDNRDLWPQFNLRGDTQATQTVWMCVLSSAFTLLPCPHDDIDSSDCIGRFS